MKSWFRFRIDELELYSLAAIILVLAGVAVLEKGEMDSRVNEGILFITVAMAMGCLRARQLGQPFGPSLSQCCSWVRERLYSPGSVVCPVEREEDDAAAPAPSLKAS